MSIGRRIHVIGNSCSGKTTLASLLNVPFVELDALNWQPNWVGLHAVNPEAFEKRIKHATRGDGWVVAGSYFGFSQRTFWPKLETLIWLDLPLYLLIWRWLTRSWRRWRTRELLWGTNYEKFWPQLKVWRKEESLLWWIITQQQPKRRRMIECKADPRWRNIRFIRLASVREVKNFLHAIECDFK